MNFFDKNQESYSRFYMVHRVTRNSDSNYVPIEGCEKGRQTFFHEIGFKVFIQYREMNHLKVKFWKEDTLVASYSRALIALEMC